MKSDGSWSLSGEGLVFFCVLIGGIINGNIEMYETTWLTYSNWVMSVAGCAVGVWIAFSIVGNFIMDKSDGNTLIFIMRKVGFGLLALAIVYSLSKIMRL